MGPKGLGLGMAWNLGISEILITLLIILVALYLFFATKEFYALTKHKGIKYFRHAFLFFAIANILKLIGVTTRYIDRTTDIFMLHTYGQAIFLLITLFMTLSIFFLAYSISWHRIEKRLPSAIHLLTLIAILFTFISVIFRTQLLLVIVNLIIFIIAIILSAKKEKKSVSWLQVTYMLMFALWIINTLALALPRYILPQIDLPISIISLAILGYIGYRIIKVTHHGKEKRQA